MTTQNLLDELLADYSLGLSYRKIAAKYGISKTKVGTIFKNIQAGKSIRLTEKVADLKSPLSFSQSSSTSESDIANNDSQGQEMQAFLESIKSDKTIKAHEARIQIQNMLIEVAIAAFKTQKNILALAIKQLMSGEASPLQVQTILKMAGLDIPFYVKLFNLEMGGATANEIIEGYVLKPIDILPAP